MAKLKPKQLFETLNRDNFRCFYCGFDGRKIRNSLFLRVDHIIPKSRRGSLTDPANLITACVRCNQIKGSIQFRDKEEARSYLQGLLHRLDKFHSMKLRRVSPGSNEQYPIYTGGMLADPGDPKFRNLLKNAVRLYKAYSGRHLSVQGGYIFLL